MPKRIISRILAAGIVLFFIFAPIRLDLLVLQITQAENEWEETDNYILINKDTTWSGNLIFDDLFKPIYIDEGATLTIKKGTHLEFIEMDVANGRIVAEGTQDEKIIFSKAMPNPDDYPGWDNLNCLDGPRGLISFNDSSWQGGMEPSIFRYVEFGNLGSYDQVYEGDCQGGWTLNNKKPGGIFYTAQAQEALWLERINPALEFKKGRLHIENSTFKNNNYNDIEVNSNWREGNPSGYLEIVNSNFEGNKWDTALESTFWKYPVGEGSQAHDNSKVILKNNWYGDVTGPRQEGSMTAQGKRIFGDYTLDGLKANDLIADPVVIIPGILGSATQYVGRIGHLKLDPIFHTFDNLIGSFKKNGYVENQNLFAFPYEWRNTNAIMAGLLKQKIQEIRNETGISKVDIVAHSMGGLVAREYIEILDYQNNIDQLITLGTPHKGSPKSYMAWEGGELGIELDSKFIRKLFEIESFHAGYGNNLKEYIQKEIPTVGELLPDYEYLYDVSDGNMKNYPDEHPANTFLEDLNKPENLAKLASVDFTNIVGKTPGTDNTIVEYDVVESTQSGKWEHGMPENFYNPEATPGIEYGEGDGTVSLSSAMGIEAAETPDPLNSDHGDLPTLAQCDVIKELTAMTDCEYVSTFERVTDILTFGVFSPVDIQIIAPEGKWAGKNIKNLDEKDQIPGAFYSGSDAINEFLTISNPQDGEYKIITEGIENGDYKIEAAKISENENTQEAEESSAIIEGIAQAGIVEQEKKIEISDDEVVNPEVQDKEAPKIVVNSPEAKDYLNNLKLAIDFAASDNKSAIDKIALKKFLDGDMTAKNEIDLSLLHLGNHTLKITAKDEAQNKSEKEVVFRNITDAGAILKNISHYAELKMIRNGKEENHLKMEIRKIDLLIKVLDKAISNPKLPDKAKEQLIKISNQKINREIDSVIKHIRKKGGNIINIQAKELLIESLEFIRR